MANARDRNFERPGAASGPAVGDDAGAGADLRSHDLEGTSALGSPSSALTPDWVGELTVGEGNDVEILDAGDIDTGEIDVDALFETRASAKLSGSGTALSLFQKTADRFPPLNTEQQLQVHLIYLEGERARAEMASHKLRGSARQKAEQAVRRGETAMEHLCASCWRLAWLLVREAAEPRFGRDRAAEMLPDLMGEANSALVGAVRDFDQTRTPKFHTFAARRVRDHLRVVLSRDTYIQVAPSWSRVKRMAVTLIPELTLKLGHHPSIPELQEGLLEQCLAWADDHLPPMDRALPEEQRHQARLTKLRKQGMLGAIRDIEEVLVATQSVASLDSPVGSGEGTSNLGDLLPAQSADSSFDRVEHEALTKALGAALSTLSDRERDILLLRHGFAEDDGEEWTYNRIADRHGVTAERIRQIEKAALAKLSSPHGQFAGLATFLPSHIDG